MALQVRMCARVLRLALVCLLLLMVVVMPTQSWRFRLYLFLPQQRRCGASDSQ